MRGAPSGTTTNTVHAASFQQGSVQGYGQLWQLGGLLPPVDTGEAGAAATVDAGVLAAGAAAAHQVRLSPDDINVLEAILQEWPDQAM